MNPGKPLILLLAALLISGSISAQSLEYRIKAEFLERFTRFIDWPAESSLTDNSKPFCMCILGENPFGMYLEEMTRTVKIKGKAVQIHEMKDLDHLQICQVVFISHSEKGNLLDILKLTENKPILTIGDTTGFAKDGVLVNFYDADGHVRFEINLSAVEKSKLKFSSRLLKLARLI